MRKAELVALLQNNGTPEDHTRSPPPPPQRRTAYVTLKFDDNGHCRIHSVSDNGSFGPGAPQGSHGNGWIVTNERYVVMPWKVVTRHGKNMGPCTAKWGKASGPSPCGAMTLTEAVDSIFSQKESEAKERERREREEIESKRKEYYETHMKKETERLNNWVNWYEVKLNEIREAPVDSRLQMLERLLYRVSEKNKNCGVTITSAGVINPLSYPEYPPDLKIPEYKSLDCVCPDPCGIHKENPFCDVPTASSSNAGSKAYDRMDCFRKVVRAYCGVDEGASKYFKKVKALIDKPLDDLEL